MQYAFCKRQGDDITDVHIVGCSDVEKGLDRGSRMMHSHGKQKAYDDYYVIDANSVDEAIDSVLEDNYPRNMYKIMPCVKR